MHEPNSNAATDPPLLLTVVQVARLLAVGRTTVYELIRTGDLRTVKIGRARRIPLSALTDYVDRLEEGIHNATPRPYAPEVLNAGGFRGVN